MDSTALTAPRDSEMINELLSRMTDESTAQTAPRYYDIIYETTATGDAWIRQPNQLLGT